MDTRAQLTQYQGVSNSNLSPNDYVTQVPQQSIMGSWEGSQIRSDDLTMSTSISESENGPNDVTTVSVKSPSDKQENIKVNWSCDSASLPGKLLFSISIYSSYCVCVSVCVLVCGQLTVQLS